MSGDFYRSLGLEVSGDKNDRTALAVMDFYPKTNRLVLVDVDAKITGFEEVSADEALVQLIQEQIKECPHYTGMSVHGPLTLPPLFSEALHKKEAADFTGRNKNTEIQWMLDLWKRMKPRPKPFVPYLERASELYLRHQTKEKFQMSEALGANFAPITARLQFLKAHLPHPLFEVFPRATLTRVVASLGLPKTLTRDYSDLERGLFTREEFFVHLAKKIPQLFIYEKDLELMVLNMNCFNAFLCSLTQHLIHTKQCELPPKNYPKTASWIHFPKSGIEWDKVFDGRSVTEKSTEKNAEI